MGVRPRITGGRLKGRPLPLPVPDSARPTGARVREALFSIVGQDLAGQRVLDAFGGSGLLGLEAWSRGARVVVVERNPRAARVIRDNAARLGAALEVHTGAVLALLPGLGDFDGILADPPYALDPGPLLAGLGPAAGRWLALETDRTADPPRRAGGLAHARVRRYGGTAIHLYLPEA